MGTPNFASPKNASKHFVVLTAQEVEVKKCPECGHFHKDWEHELEGLKECQYCAEDISEVEVETEYETPDEWRYDDLIDNLQNEIRAIGGYDNLYFFNDRNYERRAISSISRGKSFGDLEVEVKVTALIQSAYYEGATLDFIIEVNDEEIEDGHYYNTTIEDALEETIHSSDMNEGLKKIQAQHAENWAETAILDLSEQIEKILESFSEHKLNCMGVFSNGEAVYEKA